MRCACALAFGLALAWQTVTAIADPQDDADRSGIKSQSQIQEALQPARTRSFVPRGLTRRGSADAGQSVDLNVPFEHDSSALKPTATAQLQQLEAALNSPALRQDRFAVAGHTDAQGSLRHNQQLSLRRAEAVKRYLTARGIPATRLDTVGYGSAHLLDPDRPNDPNNRRVEIRDLGAAPGTASAPQ